MLSSNKLFSRWSQSADHLQIKQGFKPEVDIGHVFAFLHVKMANLRWLVHHSLMKIE